MIVSDKARMTYTAVPKNACTTMKCFFYHVNTGHDFSVAGPKKHLGYRGIHHVDGYRMGRFRARDYAAYRDYAHAAIIRDPVDRFCSAYTNRLFQYNDIRSRPDSVRRAKDAALPDQPGLGLLVDQLEAYFDISKVLRFHMRPTGFYLGDDLGFYSHLYQIHETDLFCETVRKRAGVDVPKLRANESLTTGQPDYRLTRAQYDRLLDYTASDYRLLQHWFTPRRYEQLDAAMTSG